VHVRYAAQRNTLPVWRVQRQVGELLNALFVIIAEGESNSDFARFVAKLTQILTTHGNADGHGDFRGSQSGDRGACAVNADTDFALTGFAVAAYILQTLHAVQCPDNFDAEIIQPLSRITTDLD